MCILHPPRPCFLMYSLTGMCDRLWDVFGWTTPIFHIRKSRIQFRKIPHRNRRLHINRCDSIHIKYRVGLLFALFAILERPTYRLVCLLTVVFFRLFSAIVYLFTTPAIVLLKNTGNRWIVSFWTATPHRQPSLDYTELQSISTGGVPQTQVVYEAQLPEQRPELQYLELKKRESEIWEDVARLLAGYCLSHVGVDLRGDLYDVALGSAHL